MTYKINLGCGKDILRGYLNVDIIKQDGVDLVMDIEKTPWPIKTNSISKIYCSHTLEHVQDIIKTMKEIWRISIGGGLVKIRVPHFSCGVYHRDITHKRPFSYYSMDYFCDASINYKHNDGKLFKIKKRELNYTRLSQTWLNTFINPIINLAPGLYERFFCWIFPCSEVIYTLEVIK